MTTIAIKDGELAFDSQTTRGGTICNNHYLKKTTVNGHHFFFAGAPRALDGIIDSFFNGTIYQDDTGTCGFVVTPDKKVFLIDMDQDGFCTCDDVPDGEWYAIGSGHMYAIGAMDAGCSAKEAVKIAAGRDIYTGGRIRVFKI